MSRTRPSAIHIADVEAPSGELFRSFLSQRIPLTFGKPPVLGARVMFAAATLERG
jgi:hypothetical protein